ncbi:GDSL-type esterase/lipase family protein [Chitinophaga sp. Ak27]|uniref:GDSL-type esterase/lipase family protein n=1 Tax=Chitinophaga sp. Ak27 TaxID=2726116 RepID=UPI00145CC4C7|nr:GDSL-type esterase/lipase family protein [Chitinophaga sp. Ak27]NLU92138.1 GDSL family lipase [Chitinophaga sp. Ak27]
MRKNLLLLCLACLYASAGLFAQSPLRFEKDIHTIRDFDKMYAPAPHPILFVGSSSIRKWDDLERNFSSYVVMNRGVGGAETNDVTYYANDIIFPYAPRQIVIYVGENDLPHATVTADTMLLRFQQLYGAIRAKLPAIPIIYISIKPSPSRAAFLEKAKQTNALIKNFLAKEKQSVFVDIYSKMLDKSGQPRKELFLDDMLHMNKQGYAIWEKAIQPYLLHK